MPIRFMIVAAQRTGSTVLGDALDRHPEVACEREMFLEGQKRPRSYNQFLLRSRRERLRRRLSKPRSVDAYLREFFRPEPGVHAVGMKLMYNQRDAVIDGWVARERPHLIHLVRRNHVDVIVSRLTAEARGVYHVERGQQVPQGPVAIPTEKVLQELEKLEAKVEENRRWVAAQDHLELSYEALRRTPDQLFRGVHAFLGVEPAATPELPLQKVNPDRLEDAVKNWEELCSVLRGTRFETLLEPAGDHA